MRRRLDQELVSRGLVQTRSQAESYIRLGKVKVEGKITKKTGQYVSSADLIELTDKEQYVSRAGFKLASAAEYFKLNFMNKIVLDVGSSTGGFTDYALKQGARKVIAVDVGTAQLHPSLRSDPRIELREQTNILDVRRWKMDDSKNTRFYRLSAIPGIVLIDVSFVSIRPILTHISSLIAHDSIVVAMVKPQFEAGETTKHKGVIKNEKMRREVLKDFENWVKASYKIIDKTDSQVSGEKGNIERFYLLKPIAKAG